MIVRQNYNNKDYINCKSLKKIPERKKIDPKQLHKPTMSR